MIRVYLLTQVFFLIIIKSILHFENTIDSILVYQKRNFIVITNMNKIDLPVKKYSNLF